MTTEKKAVKKFQMTINLEDYEKLKIIAEKNQRSVVGQVAYWVYKDIEKYETENGKISTVINQQHNLFANAEINMGKIK